MSRAFGDTFFKTPKNCPPQCQMVTSLPDFSEFYATNQDVVFLGCDGIFENKIFTAKSLENFVAAQLEKTDDLGIICNNILDHGLSRGSYDNMTAILIQFKDGSDFHSDGFQFIPGQFFQGDSGLEPYQKAYINDASRAGYTLQEAQLLFVHHLTAKLVSSYKYVLKNAKEPSHERSRKDTNENTIVVNETPPGGNNHKRIHVKSNLEDKKNILPK